MADKPAIPPGNGETPEETLRRLQANDHKREKPTHWSDYSAPSGQPVEEPTFQTPPPPISQPIQPPVNPYMNNSWGNTAPVDHPQTVTFLVLSILSVMCCLFISPVIMFLSKNAITESETNPNYNDNNGQLKAAYIISIIGTGFLVLGIFFNVTVGFFW